MPPKYRPGSGFFGTRHKNASQKPSNSSSRGSGNHKSDVNFSKTRCCSPQHAIQTKFGLPPAALFTTELEQMSRNQIMRCKNPVLALSRESYSCNGWQHDFDASNCRAQIEVFKLLAYMSQITQYGSMLQYPRQGVARSRGPIWISMIRPVQQSQGFSWQL